MPKKIGAVLIALGAVLIASALLLFLHNQQEDSRAGQEAEILLTQLQAIIETAETQPASTAAPEETQPTETEETAPASTEPLSEEMPRVWMDGNDYVGYVTIPDLELELPVMADWSYERLQIAPCRQFGSSRTDDLVIAAHNYESHFGTLKNLTIGAEATFTDMEGIVNRYTLTRLETVDPTNIEAVQFSGNDLVLYTCTPGGAYRVAAFFDRISE